MRSHGQLAVLKDEEIDRLERASAAVMGVSRSEVMESMYNRLQPKPRGSFMLHVVQHMLMYMAPLGMPC